MSKKKTLVALGIYKRPEQAPGAIIKSVEEVEIEIETEEEANVAKVGIEKSADIKPKPKPNVVEQDLYFCKYCDKFFETLKGKEVHESRWCKEKP